MPGSFSSQLFFSAAQRRLFTQGLPIFTYHSVANPPAASRDPFLYVTPERFAQQIETLRNHGFTSGSLDDVSKLSDNAGKKVVISFDDGYVNVLENALPTLTRNKFSSIQFIVAGLIGAQNEWDVVHGEVPAKLMDVSQIRDWLAAGQEIGSHSMTHRNLTKLHEDGAREQIFSSKKKLEDLFGIPIKHFCYPHGSHNAATIELVHEAGYETACGVEFGVNTLATPSFSLKRVVCLSPPDMFKKSIHRLGRKFSR